MRSTRVITGLVAVLCLVMLSGAAWAQGYTVTNVTGQWHTPPSSKTGLNLNSHSTTTITLPFSFTYFGNSYTSAVVGDEGFMQISPTRVNTSYPATSFPTQYDGIIAVAWYYHMHATGGSQVNTHTSGSAPNRVFHVTWEGVGSPGIYAQIQLHESTGRIVFAYTSGGNWSSANPYYLGIQAPGTGDGRYVLADGSNAGRSTMPANDFQFDPIVTNFTGRLLTTKKVVDGTGIGNSILYNQAVGGALLELVNSTGGGVVGRGTTVADGAFTVTGLSLNPAQTGTLRIVAQSQSAVVRASSTSSAATLTLPGTVAFTTSTSVGTYTLDDSTDPGSSMRECLNILTAIQKVYEFAASRTTDTIPRLDVYYDPTSTSATTAYAPGAASTSAVMQVAGTSAANPDQWDDDVIARVYALHVFRAITGVPVQPASSAYDQQASAAEALALGFGFYVRAAVKGSSTLYDGLSSSAAATIDIESDEPSRAKGPTVPGWVAMALYDLIDDDNEAHDTVDGTSADQGAPLAAVDALTSSTVGAQALFEAYVAQGGDGPGAARDFIHHGLLADDAFEPNDTPSEARNAGSVPVIQRNLVLNIANEDWFLVTVPSAVSSLTIDVAFDHSAHDTQVAMEVRNAGNGQLIGVGTPADPADPVRLVAGPVAAGTYAVRVAHEGGGVLPAYTLQAYESLEITRTTLPDWTVGVSYAETLGVRGGIPGYKLSTPAAVATPPGLVTNDAFVRLGGVPTRVGKYDFAINVADAADPPNQRSRQYSIVINDRLQVGVEAFAPLLVGKTDGFDFGRTGGTDPIVVTATTEGTLPGGLSMPADAVRLEGVPSATGSAHVAVDAVDFAGDAVSKATTVVVCAPYTGKNAPAQLAAGDSACGWPIDAVKGSEINAAVNTGKKQPKRLLDFTLVDAHGAPVPGGAVTTGKSGKAGVKKLVAPATGRYFVLCSSAEGDAAELIATISASPPKKLAGTFDNSGGSDYVDVQFGALAGAQFTLKGKPAKGSEVTSTVQWILAPDGRYLPPSQLTIVEKGTALTVSGACDVAGTWTLRVRAKPGPQGAYGWSLSIAQPKGAVYSQD